MSGGRRRGVAETGIRELPTSPTWRRSWPDTSRTEQAKRHDEHAVRAPVGVFRRREDDKGCRGRRDSLLGELEHGCRSVVDHVAAELDFDTYPGTVSAFHDEVDLELAAALAVVEDRGVVRLGVDANVSGGEGLEEVAKRGEIAEQPVYARSP